MPPRAEKPGIGTRFACEFPGASSSIFNVREEVSMSSLLKWALVFFIIAIIAAVLGFGGIAHGAADVARVLCFIFLAICVILFILGLTVYKSLP
jgi:uncharacterized membrane protein YtjA (UPF0391 family)